MDKLWKQRNPEKVKATKRRALNKELKKKFGIDYDAEALRVGGRCEACLQLPIPNSNRKVGLVVDHDHATGKYRGLLCDNCNTALGKLKDDPARIKSLLAYVLEKS